ncbi:serine--tRNA synthetase-like protein Slimp [Anthonomus grandis grandis]|uniref:serine--tRNA synthetase-like protein Slimp n=1 Tax=Anthonomus grandis grandis TaxID=2921223 RepID=UPI0021661FCF|nr:serine--tRNA synthetase-like protein Slimp [Anthonomus grandis grandis]
MLKNSLKIATLGKRQFSSALYITGDKAQTNFAVLTPVIDFDEQIKHKEELAKNIQDRNLHTDIDKVEEKWRFFKEVEGKLNMLEQTRIEIGRNLHNLGKQPADPNVEKEKEKLMTHLRLLKEDIKNIHEMSYRVEEGAMLEILNLPNKLHPKTPKAHEEELFRYLEANPTKTDSHMTIGERQGYLKLINHMSCYLKADAALLEQALHNFFAEELLHLNYTQFSNADFVKTVVAEGCGAEPNEMLTMETIHCTKSDDLNKLHITGSSSLYSFMAYFTKHFVQTTYFPIKAFSVGRRYQMANENAPLSLFNLNQTSEVGMFIASNKLDDNFLENIVNEVSTVYQRLGMHFKIVLTPANRLKKAESLRMSVQMFSNHLQDYIEVGNVSFYGDYISKRLLFNYSENKERKYPIVVGGSLLNIHKFLGCALEHNSIEGKPLLNDVLLKYVS